MANLHPFAKVVLKALVRKGKSIDSWLDSMGITDPDEIEQIKKMFRPRRVVNSNTFGRADGYK